ncbi:MAG: flagellar M-ring protein FliF [Oscillospiraceae bacterium]|nr:flagellar M-ring protein FliF [Oscillospiraceae bacterium]
MDNNATMKFFKPLKEYWDKLEKNRKILYLSVGGGLLVLIIILVLLMNRTEYAVLYSGLSSQEAGEIMTRLNDLEVPAKARGTGTILVPEKVEDALRMQLSAEGYPKSGLNYDMFEKSTGFGTTDYEKQKYMQFQIQERLQGTIKTLDNVEDAIVNLYIPERSSFVLKSDMESASASVILRIKSGMELTSAQAKNITGLVAKSVPGLSEDDIFITDTMGNTLNKTDSNQAELAGTQLQLEDEMSKSYKEKIENMLAPVLGETKFVVAVRAELDFDKRTTESTVYEPVEGSSDGIPVSINESKEKAQGAETAGNVGMDANGGAPEYPVVNGGGGNYERSDKTVNYDVNTTKNLIQKSEGTLENLSVSVILDNQDLQAGAADKVRTLVAGAVGMPAERVVVESMNFSGEATAAEMMLEEARNTNEYIRRQMFIRNAVIFGIIALVILAVILVAVALYNKKKREEEEERLRLEAERRAEEEKRIGMAIGAGEDGEEFSEKKSDKRMFIENNISKNPEFVVQLLRNWLDEYRD